MELIAEHKMGGKTLRLVKGDITTRDVDAIVNAANSSLQHGGGVAWAIVKKGGQVIQDESNRIGHVPVGEAAATTAGSLPAKVVIHAVGPIMGEGNEDNKLMNAVRNSLELATARGIKSISMPAISSGIFGFPKDRCAKILVSESQKFFEQNPLCSVQVVEFCIYDDLTLAPFRLEFDRLKST